MRLALMQPYFIPYAGYLRLFEADVFVYHDDAQYVKQSYINRNRLTTHDGKEEWLTLPLKDMPTETKINEIKFADKAHILWEKQLRRFRVFSDRVNEFIHGVSNILNYSLPVQALAHTTKLPKRMLGFDCPTYFISKIADKIPPELKGQDRVLAICEYFKVSEYINAPGGKELYDPEAFKKRGIELKILKPYEGSTLSILERLSFENVDEVRKEINANVRYY